MSIARCRAVVFGAGKNFHKNIGSISLLYDVLAVTDNKKEKWGSIMAGHAVLPVAEALSLPYDLILLTPKENRDIKEQLLELGIPAKRILTTGEMYERTEFLRLRVAFILYGGMGDFLIEANWLCHLEKKTALPEKSVDLYVESRSLATAEAVWRNCSFVNQILPGDNTYETLRGNSGYDLVLRMCIVPFVQSYDGEKLAVINPRLLDYVLRLARYGYDNYNYGFCHASGFIQTVRKIFKNNPAKNYYSFCDVFDDLGVDEHFFVPFQIEIDEADYLARAGIGQRTFITLNTGHNMDFQETGSTRAWGHSNWDTLARLLQERHKDILIVQMGTSLRANDGITADVHLQGGTSLEEAKVLMKRAAVHVDYDGGMVHVRHILGGGPSVVLFGPSGVSQHRYSENICLRKDICPEPCEWTTSEWLRDCPKGYSTPRCMEAISPEEVLDAVEACLAGQREE